MVKFYQQQLIDLNRALQEIRPEYQKRQHKVIFRHDNAPSHKAKTVQNTLEALNWELLPPCGLLTRPGFFRLPPVFFDGPRT